MKIYRALVNGENFFVVIDGVRRRVGFYTTRVVAADNSEHAKVLVLSAVREEAESRGLTDTEQQQLPRMHVVEIEEVHSIAGDPPLKTGLCLYEDDAGIDRLMHHSDRRDRSAR